MLNDIALAIDPDAAHRRWVHEFTWHLDIVPALMDALVEATLPRIPVSRGGSRFDKDQITGGGYRDNMQLLDQFDVTAEGAMVQKGAVEDARELWSWVVQYTRAVDAWITPGRPAPVLADNPDADPLSARSVALVTAGWLIDNADLIAEVQELDGHRDEMFRLIRHLRGRYGVYNHPRRARPVVCTTCGERSVVVDWVDAGNGSPRPVQGGKCRTCGQVYREESGSEGHDARDGTDD